MSRVLQGSIRNGNQVLRSDMSSSNQVEYGGNMYSEQAFEQAARYVANTTTTGNSVSDNIRTPGDIIPILGSQYNGERDIYEVLGYIRNPDIDDYRARYERQDIAEKIISLPPEDTWKGSPELTDQDGEEQSEFESAIEDLEQQTQYLQYLRRTDVVAGIGQYGLLFIGTDIDTEQETDEGEVDLGEELPENSLSGPEDISYFQPIAQDSVENWRLGSEDGLNPNDEMYNKPVRYKIDFSPIDESESDERWVHHTRILHMPSAPRDESEIKSDPRLQSILNRLFDLEKVVGSSAEMYWSGADRKFFFNIDSENAQDIPDNELDRLEQEAEQLVHQMRQHMKTFNMDLEVVGGDDPDPSGVIDSILKFISGAKGIPVRKLVGSERGELASSQDEANWFGQIEYRRNTFAEPVILRPFLQMMIELGVLPEPNGGRFEVEWPNLFELNEVEETQVQINRSEVLDNLSGGNPQNLPADNEALFEFITEGTEIEWEDREMPDPLPDGQSFPDMMSTPSDGQQPPEEQTDGSEQPSQPPQQ